MMEPLSLKVDVSGLVDVKMMVDVLTEIRDALVVLQKMIDGGIPVQGAQ